MSNVYIHYKLSRICSPTHVLQEVLEAMLENRATTTVTPHPKMPIPLSTHAVKGPKTPVSTLPFLTELQMATTLWLPRLRFKVTSPGLPALEELIRYSVVLKRPTDLGM